MKITFKSLILWHCVKLDFRAIICAKIQIIEKYVYFLWIFAPKPTDIFWRENSNYWNIHLFSLNFRAKMYKLIFGMKIQIRYFLLKKHIVLLRPIVYFWNSTFMKNARCENYTNFAVNPSPENSINWVFKACVENLKVCYCKKAKQLFLILQKHTLIIEK